MLSTLGGAGWEILRHAEVGTEAETTGKDQRKQGTGQGQTKGATTPRAPAHHSAFISRRG